MKRLLAMLYPPSPCTTSLMMNAAMFSASNLSTASISASESLVQNFILSTGSSGNPFFFTGLLKVNESAPRVLPLNALMHDTPGRRDGVVVDILLYAILIAFSTASAPLLIKNVLNACGIMDAT